MLNQSPPKKPNTADVINSYRKRRMARGPLLVYGAIGLVLIGIIVIIIYFTGNSNSPAFGGIFASDTPTATETSTPTITSTPTSTATITETPTITFTPTPSEPFPYTIVEGDTLPALVERFNLGDDGILLILDYNPEIVDNNGVYFVGQTIIIPPPGTVRATATPIPADLPRGTQIEYKVLPGDTLAGIAAKFNSLTENIILANDIEDANALQVGQTLQIPVNLVTPTATLPPTSTPITPTVAGGATQAATATPGGDAATCDFSGNGQFVLDLGTLVNNARTAQGLPALSVNQQLVAAAREHAIDMLCNNYLSHKGLDDSTPESRVAAQGYTASLVVEDIYALHPDFGINAQTAFDWWINNPRHRTDLLNPETTVFGIAYVESDESLLGAYFVMVSAKP
ncbi:MAG: LysM peptidoglycan-binding domain-containing protein [Anaerolineales bacterium]|nr:LysM peptidoglycan-binding domain-containing protein [Anaerolineales bacterium]